MVSLFFDMKGVYALPPVPTAMLRPSISSGKIRKPFTDLRNGTASGILIEEVPWARESLIVSRKAMRLESSIESEPVN
jgi:hypothetical protein